MNRIVTVAIIAFFLIAGKVSAQDVPDVNLRMILNDAIPGGLTDVNGNVTNPNAYVDMLDINSDASFAPMDLTGLEFVSCNYLRMGSQAGGSFTNFPAFPTMVGPDAVIQVDLFDGPELPPLPSGLSVFLLWSPQPTLQSWYLNGYDDGIDLNVEVNNLSAGTPWATVTEYVNYLSVAAYPLVEPPVLGPGVNNISIWGGLEMTTMPVFNTDLQSLELIEFPMITSMSFAGQVDSLEVLKLGGFGELTTISSMPVVDIAIEFSDMPQLASVEFGPCSGSLSVAGTSGSGLTTLPPELNELFISGVEDLVLPPLPASLRTLYIDQCSVANVPALREGLEDVVINATNTLSCIPYLPSTLINFSMPGVACFPNQPPMVAAIPLCTILNSYCRELSPSIAGHVFYDMDNDGVQGPLEPSARNVSIRCMPTGHLVGTDEDGNYDLGLPIGQHTISLVDVPFPFTGTTPVSHMVDLVSVNEHIAGFDFALNAPDGFTIDRRVDQMFNSVARPGFEHQVFLDCSIIGSDTDSTVLTIEFDTGSVFVSSDLDYESVVDHTMIVRLPPNSTASISGHIRLFLPPPTSLGSTLTLRAAIGPDTNDANTTNDSLTFTYTVVGSFDPNDKQVFPDVLTLDQLTTDTPVEYQIRFQNTGTFLAERVLITDTLSTELRWDTFRFLQSSHPCEWFMREGVVHFVFNEIFLPDSTSDEPGSHGFVRFSIRPDQILMEGAVVNNEANIYFDFNEPVITDPCELMIELPTGIAQTHPNGLKVYPVPASDRITLLMPFEAGPSGYIMSADGRIVRTFASRGEQVKMDIIDLRPGPYVIHCTDLNSRIYQGRFVKL